jgi:hypothetical protein
LEDFEAVLRNDREVIRLRPQHAIAHMRITASLAYLGRMDEARHALLLVQEQFPEVLARTKARLPWWPQKFHARLMEGLRLAAGERAHDRASVHDL